MEARIQQLTNDLAALATAHQQAIQQLQTAQQQIVVLQQAQAQGQPNGPRVKPPKPPVFTGSAQPSAVNWCYLMETYLQACGVDLTAPTAVPHAAGFLRDSALTWYRNHLAAVQRGVAVGYNNWENFKAALITHFTPISPERTARQKLDTLQQGGKSARTYAEQFNLCMLELPDMHEKDRVHRFLEGLRPEVRIHVELKNPATLSDAIEWAIQADSLVWQIKKRRSSPTPGASHYPIHQQRQEPRTNGPTPMELGAADTKRTNTVNYTNGVRRQNFNNRRQNFNNARRLQSKKSTSDVECFYCHRLGHYQNNCPKRAADLAMMSDGASPQQSN